MIAPEAMNDNALVAQANATIASRDERQIALFAPKLVPRHRDVRAHGDLPGQLDVTSPSRDVAFDRRGSGQRHKDHHSLFCDPFYFFITYASLGHYILPNASKAYSGQIAFP
jgi:hypothetical protein